MASRTNPAGLFSKWKSAQAAGRKKKNTKERNVHFMENYFDRDAASRNDERRFISKGDPRSRGETRHDVVYNENVERIPQVYSPFYAGYELPYPMSRY